MAFGSSLKSDFRVARSVDGDVTIAVKTVPAGGGDWGLFPALAAGLFLTAILGSGNADIRSSAGPVVIVLLMVFALAGLGFKVLTVWAARKTSGIVTYSPRTRTLSESGLDALFPLRTVQLPLDGILVLDAVKIRRRGAKLDDSTHDSVVVRLSSVPAAGRSPDQMAQLVEAHRQKTSDIWFSSLDQAPLPEGASLLGTAFENPIFRRVAAVLAESGAGTAYDTTGLATAVLTETPRKSAPIGAAVKFSVPTVSLPIKMLATVMGIAVSGFIALISLNLYLFVYVLLLLVFALSTRQILVCDDDGLHLQYRYFMGLWRRGQDHRRWDEITAIQMERSANGFLALAIRRADGVNWAIVLPNERTGRHIEQQIKGFISPHLPG